MTRRAPSVLGFLIALFAAPALFGAGIWLLMQAGDYAGRFAMVGGYGLLLSLPLWFTIFAWLAWRALGRGETAPRAYVMAALGANLGALALYPALALLAGPERLGIGAGAIAPEGGAAPSLMASALLAGVAAFFLGVFFLPILGALFVWIGRRVGLFQ